MVVIVTRPASSGQRLFDRVAARGYSALWWPAFDIGAAPDAEHARAKLARLSDYDLAIFVSAHAVRAARELMDREWPAGTAIGAVGAATRAAVEAELQPVPDCVVAASDDDQQAGSEAFWRAWQARAQRAQQVLIVRAEDGRAWLGARFVQQGATVDAVAVYTRRSHRLSDADAQRVRQWIAAGELPATVFSSTESVAALDQHVDDAVKAWLRSGTAIACHPRIAGQLRESGYARVMNATFDDDAIIAKLESIGMQA